MYDILEIRYYLLCNYILLQFSLFYLEVFTKMTKSNGKIGEFVAEKFLVKRGYKIIERNYRKKVGEIDLIANYENYIIFIEVKLRSSISYGYPAEYVTKKKQEKITKVAYFYLNSLDDKNFDIRFDVIAIIKEGIKYHIEHIQDAF